MKKAILKYCWCAVGSMLVSICMAISSAAEDVSDWTQQFENTFIVSGRVGDISFRYPKEFELSETTTGLFLEAKDLFGQISQGLINITSKEEATELLVIRQGGKNINESTVSGNTVFASSSLQGEQICRTYIVVLKNDAGHTRDKPLYIQFRWKAANPIDYTAMLDQLVSTIK